MRCSLSCARPYTTPMCWSSSRTIYRTGPTPELMELLREAVRRGKEVMAAVELKARF